jgi:proteasome lid subunit RPN8/RPN11
MMKTCRRLPVKPSVAAAALAFVATASAAGALAFSGLPARQSTSAVVLLGEPVRAAMNELFRRHNEHWDELEDMNTLERMLGTVGPTQREYMGCLRGRAARDTVWVHGWKEAENLKQLQFAVDGSCENVPDFVGVWHTHPYRADLSRRAVKERVLSALDLATFGEGKDLVAIVVWDVDSLDAAVRSAKGEVVHPVSIVVR